MKRPLEKILNNILSKDRNFKQALNVVEKISAGKIWLIGSAVYKNLISEIHGFGLPVKDHDFIIEKFKTPMPTIHGWTESRNSWDCLKLKKGALSVDIVSLNELIAVREYGREPSIESYLWQVPLSVHSVAYEIKSGKLVGEGIKDIKRGVLRIHNQASHDQRISKWGEEFSLENIAKKLNLKARN